jgi:hypothetical protein
MASIRQNKTPYAYKAGPAAVAVTVHQTATTDFAASKHDYNESESEKPVRVFHRDTVAALRD